MLFSLFSSSAGAGDWRKLILHSCGADTEFVRHRWNGQWWAGAGLHWQRADRSWQYPRSTRPAVSTTTAKVMPPSTSRRMSCSSDSPSAPCWVTTVILNERLSSPLGVVPWERLTGEGLLSVTLSPSPLNGVTAWGPNSQTGTSQVLPVNPGEQKHWKVETLSIQRPPLRQGWLMQSSRLMVQKRPVKPAGHRQEKRFTPSKQVAPLAQGRIRQSSMLVSQRGPEKPARHRQDSSGA